MTTLNQVMYPAAGKPVFQLKDPVSALTHLGGAVCAFFAMPALLIKASRYGCSENEMIAYAVFMMSMVILYSASAAYHSFTLNGRAARIMKKIDHCSIFLLIAGSYTPVAVAVLPESTGIRVLTAVWVCAAAGILFKAVLVFVPKWVSSVMYIAMGWICIPFLPSVITALSTNAFTALLAGGIFYTAGGIIYALKKDILKLADRGFGNHELFHCFVLAGSFCHFICFFNYVCCGL